MVPDTGALPFSASPALACTRLLCPDPAPCPTPPPAPLPCLHSAGRRTPALNPGSCSLNPEPSALDTAPWTTHLASAHAPTRTRRRGAPAPPRPRCRLRPTWQAASRPAAAPWPPAARTGNRCAPRKYAGDGWGLSPAQSADDRQSTLWPLATSAALVPGSVRRQALGGVQSRSAPSAAIQPALRCRRTPTALAHEFWQPAARSAGSALRLAAEPQNMRQAGAACTQACKSRPGTAGRAHQEAKGDQEPVGPAAAPGQRAVPPPVGVVDDGRDVGASALSPGLSTSSRQAQGQDAASGRMRRCACWPRWQRAVPVLVPGLMHSAAPAVPRGGGPTGLKWAPIFWCIIQLPLVSPRT